MKSYSLGIHVPIIWFSEQSQVSVEHTDALHGSRLSHTILVGLVLQVIDLNTSMHIYPPSALCHLSQRTQFFTWQKYLKIYFSFSKLYLHWGEQIVHLMSGLSSDVRYHRETQGRRRAVSCWSFSFWVKFYSDQLCGLDLCTRFIQGMKFYKING